MRKYTTIYFDLDNTLLDFTKSEYKAIRKLLVMYGLKSDDETAKIYSEINKSFWEAFERGEIKKEEIFSGRFKKLLSVLDEERDSVAMGKDYFSLLSEGYDVVDGAFEILKFLRENGYKIYATTNGVAMTQYKRVKNSGLEPLFDGVFVSEEAGHQKPEKEYFDYVMANTDEKNRENILVIGDSQSSDILGAQNAGLDSCWYNPKDAKSTYFSNYQISSLSELQKILA